MSQAIDSNSTKGMPNMWKSLSIKKQMIIVRIFAVLISLVGYIWFKGLAWIGIVFANMILLWQDIDCEITKVR